MHILVTGAAGFIGSHLVDRLLARGDRVTGLDNFDPFYSPAEKRANLASALADPQFCLVEGDITDESAVEGAFRTARADAVVHLAAKAGVRPSLADPAGYERVNVGGTQTVLDAASRAGVRAFVLGSSSSVYGNSAQVPFREDNGDPAPISPYAATKLAAEDACRDHHARFGGAITCLRFFVAYGPRQRPDLAIRRFSALMAAGRPIPMYGDGTSERDYTWIDDLLDGVVAAIDRTGRCPGEFQVINLGSNRPTPLKSLISLIGDALGVEPVIEHLPAQPGDVTRTWADLTKAKHLLGYTPHTPLETGIPLFVEWLRSDRQGARPA